MRRAVHAPQLAVGCHQDESPDVRGHRHAVRAGGVFGKRAADSRWQPLEMGKRA